MLWSVAKDVFLSSHSKTTHYTQNYLLNCFSLSIVLFFQKFSNKAPGLLFIFICVSMGYATFQMTSASMVFFLHLKSWLGKLVSKSVDGRYARFSTGKETHLQTKAYLYVSHFEALFSLYFLYKGCFCQFNGLLR